MRFLALCLNRYTSNGIGRPAARVRASASLSPAKLSQGTRQQVQSLLRIARLQRMTRQ